MSELEDAIRDQRARVMAHVAPEEFPDGGESYNAALARLERLVAMKVHEDWHCGHGHCEAYEELLAAN